jgi:16S rRNA (cytosine967-C5)-methyltransferase
VYSTCSILPHEGESQIDSALSRHNIELLEPIVTGSPGYPGFKCSSMVRRLFPHLHGCNGFFIARMRIKQ